MPFRTTPSKDLIRRQYDRPIIKDFSNSIKDKLTYFGLPGKNLLDVREWKRYIRRLIAVERNEIIAHIIMENVYDLGFKLADSQLLDGDIDNILIRGLDKREVPIKFKFNLVNLDYEGGILHKQLKGTSRRLKAIRSLFAREREWENDFILLFTFSARNRDENELNRILDIMQDGLAKYGILHEHTESVFDWYREQRYDYKIKIYVINLIEDLAVASGFVPIRHPPVTYLGHKARMVHFAFQFRWKPTISDKMKNLIDIVNTDMFEVQNGKLEKLKLPAIILE